jgi:outer membrane protein assembly factor BamA
VVSFEAAGIFSANGYKLLDIRFGSYNKTDPVFFSGPSDFGVPFDFVKERPGVKKTRTVLFGDAIYRNFPQERFWGLGPGTEADARTNYLQEDFSFAVIGGYEFTNWFAAAVGAGLYKVDIREGTDDRYPTTQEFFDDSSAPGLDRQPDFYRLLSAIYFNYQDNPGNPHKGGIVGVFFSRYDQRRGQEFTFTRLELDARHYIPLGSRQRTLAVRLYTSNSFVGEGSRVPFYLSPTLGGGKILRGFHDFRFRDINLAYLSAEYRWEPAPAFELALFYDLGTVFPEGYRFKRDDLEGTFGGGVRFKTSNRVVLRFDVGKSNEGTRFQFSFGPSF